MARDKPSAFELYMHYKGNRYIVVGLVRHSETQEEMVAYRRLGDPDAETWVRPLCMWTEKVACEERHYCGPRFVRITRTG